ncbi:HlyD family secretion protein [Roseibium suaedae]|uniref:HlyD family secretion protein n=1 Tax=Roseibium suaedae TaxID=735517 RepID=UPI0009FCFF0F|nr:HlyD family secretion protein [Roseibium suaedae]
MTEKTEAPADAPQTKSVAAEPAKPKSGKGKKILTLVLLAGVCFAGFEGYNWWTHGRFVEETDDAYVTADITTVLSKVSGYVSEIAVSDNEVVRQGDVLLTIEDGDYKLAVQAAKDALNSAKVTVERISDQIKAGEASVLEAQAGVKSAEASLEDSNLTFKRQESLTKSRVASQATLDTARTSQMSAEAKLEQAKAAVEIAKANISVLEGQKKEAEQAVKSAQTSLEKAERDLEFTVVRATVDGIVGNRAAQIGSFLQAGSRIAAIVPLSEAHISANFKETQLGDIRQGAKVKVSVDAYPDATLTGTVESISPATGSVFSLLPSENATGNFTKVVQRVPVKIVVTPEELAAHPLRAGMSVIVEVDTRTGGEGKPAALAFKN